MQIEKWRRNLKHRRYETTEAVVVTYDMGARQGEEEMIHTKPDSWQWAEQTDMTDKGRRKRSRSRNITQLHIWKKKVDQCDQTWNLSGKLFKNNRKHEYINNNWNLPVQTLTRNWATVLFWWLVLSWGFLVWFGFKLQLSLLSSRSNRYLRIAVRWKWFWLFSCVNYNQNIYLSI